MAGNAFTSATSLGASKSQVYGTPKAFIDRVEHCWGKIMLDLAADERYHVCDKWLGAGGLHEDALAIDWQNLWVDARWAWEGSKSEPKPLFWLNPPFAQMVPWVTRCAELGKAGGRVALLAPANVGANWWWDHVQPHAHVLILTPRLAFDGAPLRGKIGDKGLSRELYGKALAAGLVVGAEKGGSASIDPEFFRMFAHEGASDEGFVPLPFPGALMLALYGCGDEGKMSRWAWKE